MSSADDLATPARIRDAAVRQFGRTGFARTTVRAIAAEAGVSAGLVIHHFGSKDGLREACDTWVMSVIREERAAMALGGGLPAMQTYVEQNPEFAPVLDYLVAALREGGDVADSIWERLLDVTRELLSVSEQSGAVHLPEDREAAAAYLVAASCGVMLMADQFARTLGGTSLTDPTVFVRYGLATTDVFTDGIFTPEYGAALRQSLTAPSDSSTSPAAHAAGPTTSTPERR